MTDRLRQTAEVSADNQTKWFKASDLDDVFDIDAEFIAASSPNTVLRLLDLADLVRQDIAAGRCWPEAEAALAALNQETHA